MLRNSFREKESVFAALTYLLIDLASVSPPLIVSLWAKEKLS